MSAALGGAATGLGAARAATQQVLRAGTTANGPVALSVTPESAGWGYSGLSVVELAPGESYDIALGSDEAVVLPLAGSGSVEVDGATYDLVGRPGVLSGPSDFLYLPLGSRAVLTARLGTLRHRFAVATARATRTLTVRHVPARAVRVELRGAGACSRQVNNYTLGTDVDVDRLLVCEVVTPGGNWSSYPPHKHDVHADDERELEEIYYFEVAPGPHGDGIGYHRVYGSGGRPIDVLEEVRTGDVVLVPHGYHGPSMAAPGYDLYYLNVMAGPSDDGRWLSTDDPAHHWVRDTWAGQEIDPRLPVGHVSYPSGHASASPVDKEQS